MSAISPLGQCFKPLIMASTSWFPWLSVQLSGRIILGSVQLHLFIWLVSEDAVKYSNARIYGIQPSLGCQGAWKFWVFLVLGLTLHDRHVRPSPLSTEKVHHRTSYFTVKTDASPWASCSKFGQHGCRHATLSHPLCHGRRTYSLQGFLTTHPPGSPDCSLSLLLVLH